MSVGGCLSFAVESGSICRVKHWGRRERRVRRGDGAIAAALGSMVVHYYLRDEKHSMDAYVRNKAEAEMLGIVRHVQLQLNLDVNVETTVREEGGLVETWLLIVNNPALLVTAAIGLEAS